MLLRRSPYPKLHLLFSRLHLSTDALVPNPNPNDTWIVKIISTVFLLSPSSAAVRLIPFQQILSPSIAFEAIRRLNNPESALEFFELTRSEFHLNHSIATYDLLIRILCQSGLPDAALKVFDEMRSKGHSVNGSALVFLVKSYAEAGDLDAAMRLLGRISEYKCRVSLKVYNDLMTLSIAKDRVNEAVCFFKEQLSAQGLTPDTCSFNIVIKGLCRLGDIDGAFEFLNKMGSFGCSPDTVTLNIIVDGLCRAKQVDRGCEFLQRIQSDGLCIPNVVTYTSIISGYCKMGEMEEAFGVFSEMIGLGIKPSRFTYNVLIDGYGKAEGIASAVSMFERMMVAGCPPDIVTFTSLIDGYCRSGQLDDAMKLWHEMGKRKLSPNVYTFAIVINALCKKNRLSEARDLLKELNRRRDVVPRAFIYNPVIDGFCKVGNVDEANSILGEMEEKRCFPDKFTYTILIIGHCMKGRMGEAISLYHKMVTTGCAPDSITVSSFMSCLLKAGMPNEANHIVLTASGKGLRLDKEIPSSLWKNRDISVAA